MSKVRGMVLWTAVGFLLLASGLQAQPAATLETSTRPSGETFFALTLDPPEGLAARVPHEVVVLFDTSAGQTAMFREMGLAALEELVGGLSEESRIKLVAVDLQAVPLTDGFVGPRSQELRAAMARLKQRAPLGSTDMQAALSAAAEAFASSKDRAEGFARSAVYIGGGRSTVNVLTDPVLAELVARLRMERIDVSSYALGVRTDAQLLAAVANQTGGNLIVAPPPELADDAQGITPSRADQENLARGRQAGRTLATWAEAEVLWPVEAKTSKAISTYFPREMPPMRADRATVLVGKTSEPLDDPVTVSVSADARGSHNITWTATALPSNPDQAYLAAMVELAETNGGVTLPTVGREGLIEARRVLHTQMENLTSLAQHAVSAGDADTADRIAEAVLRYDPENPRAMVARKVAARQLAGGQADASPSASTDDLTLLRLAQGEDRGPAGPDDAQPVPGSFLEDYLGEQAIMREAIRKDVEMTLDAARRIMAEQPEQAIQDLKLRLEAVRRAAELDAETRAQLVDRLEAALREAEQRAAVLEDILRERDAAEAARRAQQDINARIMRDIQKEQELMRRFTALMQETNYDEALEVAGFVDEVAPGEVVPRAAVYDARLVLNDDRGQLVRAMRHTAFVDTLHQVEISSISFPDDPPVVYPPAEVWEALSARRVERYSSVDLKGQEDAQIEIRKALEGDPVSMNYVDFPLSDVMDDLSTKYNMHIELDTRALTDLGIDSSTLVTATYRGMTLRSALRLMLEPLELTYIIEDEYLLITTVDEAEQRLTTKVYPVADLVLPITTLPPLGGGGLGGGFGGGLGGGGLGGGFGGGGLGGFGGGGLGGGFGGGGLGGGFFAVPDAPVDRSEDDLATTSKKPLAAATHSTPAVDDEPVAAIEFDESADPTEFWNALFSTQRPDARSVRQTVRELMQDNNTAQTIALIQAALTNGQPQPWMYEALAISLQLEGRPQDEVERAIVSAVDFARNSDDLMQIARFMTHIGLDQRALGVYRQVVKLDPVATDAYLHGLRAAQRLNDIDGIRWGTVGILSQAWTAEEAEVKQVAFRAAVATLEDLVAQHRDEERLAYQQELDRAMVRDCVIKVSWTGNADVDLIVEEPSGTVCSIHHPRTTSGGVNLGDTYAKLDKSPSQSFSEVYVCPEAFSGEYRARIRKVWGDVTAGKASVEVWTNYRTKEVQYERQHVDVGADDALVVFNLERGRRRTPLAEAQLANAVEKQVLVNRAVLAQQMRALVDPRVGLRSGSGSLGSGVAIGPGGQPVILRRGGAVGYQPQITVLPAGTTLTAIGVVSSDRRYVRITASPSFTSIGDVTTFTFAGAAQQVDQDQGMDMGQDMDMDTDIVVPGGGG